MSSDFDDEKDQRFHFEFSSEWVKLDTATQQFRQPEHVEGWKAVDWVVVRADRRPVLFLEAKDYRRATPAKRLEDFPDLAHTIARKIVGSLAALAVLARKESDAKRLAKEVLDCLRGGVRVRVVFCLSGFDAGKRRRLKQQLEKRVRWLALPKDVFVVAGEDIRIHEELGFRVSDLRKRSVAGG